MNLYVSNLGSQVTNESLHAIFATHGQVDSATVFINEMKGTINHAYVLMPNDREALLAIARLHGAVLNGSTVSVENAARPQDPPNKP